MSRIAALGVCLLLAGCATARPVAGPCAQGRYSAPPRFIYASSESPELGDSAVAVVRVLRLCEATPLEQAAVTLTTIDGGSQTRMTDPAGQLMLRGAAGNYRMLVRAIGYARSEATITLRAGFADTLVVQLRRTDVRLEVGAH